MCQHINKSFRRHLWLYRVKEAINITNVSYFVRVWRRLMLILLGKEVDRVFHSGLCVYYLELDSTQLNSTQIVTSTLITLFFSCCHLFSVLMWGLALAFFVICFFFSLSLHFNTAHTKLSISIIFLLAFVFSSLFISTIMMKIQIKVKWFDGHQLVQFVWISINKIQI